MGATGLSGTVLFTTYFRTLGDILQNVGVQSHCYAKDTFF